MPDFAKIFRHRIYLLRSLQTLFPSLPELLCTERPRKTPSVRLRIPAYPFGYGLERIHIERLIPRNYPVERRSLPNNRLRRVTPDHVKLLAGRVKVFQNHRQHVMHPATTGYKAFIQPAKPARKLSELGSAVFPDVKIKPRDLLILDKISYLTPDLAWLCRKPVLAPTLQRFKHNHQVVIRGEKIRQCLWILQDAN